VDEPTPATEGTRLEALWAGDFGDDYVDRNAASYDVRQGFWESIVTTTGCRSALEIGCNVGGNLRWLAPRLPEGATVGVDINRKALSALHAAYPAIDALWSPARDLPFRDRRFDLVFTMGVLIHQPTSTLPLVMHEMVRCSARWVLCGEYFAEATEEVSYRGHEGALFRRDYGRLFAELFPELTLAEQGFLAKDDGWDDVTWWLFERR
jgi:spore coat polysaccharide biosynthesis protein SpsF